MQIQIPFCEINVFVREQSEADLRENGPKESAEESEFREFAILFADFGVGKSAASECAIEEFEFEERPGEAPERGETIREKSKKGRHFGDRNDGPSSALQFAAREDLATVLEIERKGPHFLDNDHCGAAHVEGPLCAALENDVIADRDECESDENGGEWFEMDERVIASDAHREDEESVRAVENNGSKETPEEMEK